MYHISVIGSIGPVKTYFKSIDGWFQNIQQQTLFKWTEHIIIYSQWHKIFDEYKNYDNIFFYQENLKGVYNAWNEGIKKSTTNIVTTWNIDDRRYPKANEKKFIILKKKLDIDLVYNWINITSIENDDVNNPKEIWRQSSRLDPDDKNWKYKCQCGPDPMWRKELHEKAGYFDGNEFPVSADWDMWMRFNQIGAKMFLLKEPLCLYYLNPVGVSTSKNGFLQSEIDDKKILKKYKIINE